MQSLAYIPASNGSGNASLATIQAVRAPLAVTNTVNTVAGFPVNFYATMGTPRSTVDPVTGETITVITEASAVDFAGTINAGKIDIVAIAPGYTDLGSKVGDIIIVRPVTEWANNLFNLLGKSLNDDGSIKASAITYNPTMSDNAVLGGIWALVSGLNGSMTALTLWQAGYLGSVAALASRTFTASKDTYVNVLRTLSGYTNTFTLVYTEVANGAAAPALAANSMRLAKVVTNGSTITSVVQSGNSDGIGNIIRPAGSVSTAQLKNPVKFCVYRNSTHSWNQVASGWNQYSADTKEYDYGNNYNTTTWTFTAPVTGFYDFEWNMQINNPGSSNQAAYPRLVINGVTYREVGNSLVQNNCGTQLTAMNVPLKAGDQVTVTMAGSVGLTSVAGNLYSHWAGSLRSVD